MEAPVLVGASEGQGWRYEVVERTEGFLVRSRDIDTGVVDDGESRLFRTASVAFAYAEMSARFDRYAAARVAGDDAEEQLAELDAQQALYNDLRRRLADDGMAALILAAWEEAEETAQRRRYH